MGWGSLPCPALCIPLTSSCSPQTGAAAPSLPPQTRGQAPSCRARPQSPFLSLAPRGAQGQTAKSRNCKKPPARACLCVFIHGQGSPVQEICICTRTRGRPTTARYNCTCLLQTKQAFILCWKFPPVKSEPLSEDGPVHA